MGFARAQPILRAPRKRFAFVAGYDEAGDIGAVTANGRTAFFISRRPRTGTTLSRGHFLLHADDPIMAYRTAPLALHQDIQP